jgi:SAM-dependent methyltransferase
MRKYILAGPYNPVHDENKMSSEGSVSDARARFLETRFANVEHLLKFRYEWMNKYLQSDSVIIEVGAGAGFSPLYLSEKPILTDAANNPWIDKYIDATDMDLEDGSVDVIIASHNIHHFYSPFKFFKECERVLKKDGLILIQEINTSLMMRVLLRLMRHEGWSYNVNVFNPDEIVNDADDLWSANCAVPEMLFNDPNRFEQVFTPLRVIRNEPCECLIFPLSGGVISKTKVPQLPIRVLDFILFIDKILVAMLPSIFALGRRVVLKKNG